MWFYWKFFAHCKHKASFPWVFRSAIACSVHGSSVVAIRLKRMQFLKPEETFQPTSSWNELIHQRLGNLFLKAGIRYYLHYLLFHFSNRPLISFDMEEIARADDQYIIQFAWMYGTFNISAANFRRVLLSSDIAYQFCDKRFEASSYCSL